MSRVMRDQLPAFMAADPFLDRFLRIFEDVHASVTAHGDQLEDLIDVSVAPPALVRWMGTWLGIQVDASISEARQRQIVKEASRSYGLRGTLEGLRGMLAVLTGGDVVVEDGCGVFAEDEAPANPKLVTVRLTATGEYAMETLRRFIVQEIPADVDYEIYLGGRLEASERRVGSVSGGTQRHGRDEG